MIARRIEYRITGPGRRRPRLGDVTTDATGQQYEVSAAIVSQTTMDGQPLDSPLVLATDPSGSGSNSNIDNTGSGPATPAQIAAATAAAKARAGGSGSGGLGLANIFPVNIPAPLQWLAAALLLGGTAFLVLEKRR